MSQAGGKCEGRRNASRFPPAFINPHLLIVDLEGEPCPRRSKRQE